MFNSNFDLVLQIDDQGIRVTGSSTEIENATLVLRRVTLQQDGTVAEGKTDFGMPRWGAAPALPAAGFTEGEALALGTEMYFVKSPTPGYASFTWSQGVTLEKS
jgi:hypothetical protein